MDCFVMESGETVYYHIPETVKENRDTKVPLVLFMCGTSCDPVENCVDSGWIEESDKENFIVVSPDYNNYATYSETDFLMSVVDEMVDRYPIDTERIYSTGFSNGGAASVALTSDYPDVFAAISAMGWMVGMEDKMISYDMPFQVIQGSGEFTEQLSSGIAVMQNEREAIRDLFLYNEMIEEDTPCDYASSPYWGYTPDEKRIRKINGRKWEISNYYKEGYASAFAQLIIVEDDEHRCRKEEAELAWQFFKQFKRNSNGEIEMVQSQKKTYKDIVYDEDLSLKLDLFLPKGEGPHPLVFFIHGGGWFGGHKQDGQEKAWMTLTESGYAVTSVDYRLSTEAPHPAGIIDCKNALRYLKAHAQEYHLDKERIAVAGDSSGGHYALMLALTPGNPDFEEVSEYDETTEVQCAVVWYPATDLAETMRTVQSGEYTGFGAQFAWENIERYIGKTITDVNDQALVQASPIHYIHEDMPPILLQHGNADTICPIDQSKRFLSAAEGQQVFLDVIEGAEHGDSAFETKENMERIVKFLDAYL